MAKKKVDLNLKKNDSPLNLLRQIQTTLTPSYKAALDAKLVSFNPFKDHSHDDDVSFKCDQSAILDLKSIENSVFYSPSNQPISTAQYLDINDTHDDENINPSTRLADRYIQCLKYRDLQDTTMDSSIIRVKGDMDAYQELLKRIDTVANEPDVFIIDDLSQNDLQLAFDSRSVPLVNDLLHESSHVDLELNVPSVIPEDSFQHECSHVDLELNCTSVKDLENSIQHELDLELNTKSQVIPMERDLNLELNTKSQLIPKQKQVQQTIESKLEQEQIESVNIAQDHQSNRIKTLPDNESSLKSTIMVILITFISLGLYVVSIQGFKMYNGMHNEKVVKVEVKDAGDWFDFSKWTVPS